MAGQQRYHDPVQNVHQLESVVSAVGGVLGDGVVVLRQESPDHRPTKTNISESNLFVSKRPGLGVFQDTARHTLKIT